MDIGATLVDYAGAPMAPEFRGLSLRPVIEGHAGGRRDYVLSQFGNHSCVISDHLKIEFSEDGEVCVAFDRLDDPDEQMDISGEPSYQSDIETARQWLERTTSDAPVRPDSVTVE